MSLHFQVPPVKGACSSSQAHPALRRDWFLQPVLTSSIELNLLRAARRGQAESLWTLVGMIDLADLSHRNMLSWHGNMILRATASNALTGSPVSFICFSAEQKEAHSSYKSA
jgi:hypothetical protein